MIPVRVADRYMVNFNAWARGDVTSLPYNWCLDHIQRFSGDDRIWWFDQLETFYFENEKDAVLFALHWA